MHNIDHAKHCRTSHKFNLLMFFLFGMTIFFPKFFIKDTAYGLDDLLTPIAFLLFLLPMLNHKILVPINKLFLLWVVLISHGIIFGLIGSFYYTNGIVFPSEMWQYIRRMVFFYLSFYLAWKRKVPAKHIFFALVLMMMIANFVGILQAIPNNYVGNYLCSLYARTDRQFISLVERTLASKRVYGIAGHSTAWGGFCAFGLSLTLYAMIKGIKSPVVKYSKLSKTLVFICTITCMANILLSGSRVAILVFLILIIFVGALVLITRCDRTLILTKLFLFLVLSILILFYFFADRTDFILYRYSNLISGMHSGIGRMNQIEIALDLFRKDFHSILFGTGNAAQRIFAMSFGTEVEPVYLLVNYGISGFLLRYGLLMVIFKFSCIIWKKSNDTFNAILSAASMCAIVSYIVFSAGYFFFQELYVGTFPWLLFGWISGEYYRGRYFDRSASIHYTSGQLRNYTLQHQNFQKSMNPNNTIHHFKLI